MSVEKSLLMAAQALQAADALLIAAGAGMGVDSGLPDFRGPEGFWRSYPALRGYSFEQMANPLWFDREPTLAWAFYGHRLNLYRATRPHAGFARLLEIANKLRCGFFVFTSNVDGQFQKAGYPPEQIVECHGSIHHFQCTEPCCAEILAAEGEEVRLDEKLFRACEPLPQCTHCGALARPNILMFGDGDWLQHRTDAQMQQYRRWLDSLAASARLVVVEIGAGTAVATVRYEAENRARRSGSVLIRINPREPNVPPGQVGIGLGAAEALEKISRLTGGEKFSSGNRHGIG